MEYLLKNSSTYYINCILHFCSFVPHVNLISTSSTPSLDSGKKTQNAPHSGQISPKLHKIDVHELCPSSISTPYLWKCRVTSLDIIRSSWTPPAITHLTVFRCLQMIYMPIFPVFLQKIKLSQLFLKFPLMSFFPTNFQCLLLYFAQSSKTSSSIMISQRYLQLACSYFTQFSQ